MFSFNFSIVTSVINSLGFEMDNHNYFVNTFSGFLIIGGCVAWGALPFITISIYAALTQVPKELLEAAEIDGANSRQVFRNIIFPILLPVYIIIISLSVIWVLSEYGMGAAISLIMIFTLITITGYYLRQMMKMGND
jgi:N,N'-diacetylchitobiose transport system permease protein